MGDVVLVMINEVAVKGATVLVTDYGYRVKVSEEARLTLGAGEGSVLRFGVGREVGQFRWVSTYPFGNEVWIALRRMELDRPKKREGTRRKVKDVFYG